VCLSIALGMFERGVRAKAHTTHILGLSTRRWANEW